MSPAGRRPDAASGFTLIELMVVLAVISLLLVFAVPAILSGGSHADVKVGAGALATSLRLARAQAVRRNAETTVTIDVEGRRFTSNGDGKIIPLPDGVDINVFTARREIVTGALARIRFFPDGSSTGGRVTLARAGRSVHVSVDWLTGGVSVDQ